MEKLEIKRLFLRLLVDHNWDTRTAVARDLGVSDSMVSLSLQDFGEKSPDVLLSKVEEKIFGKTGLIDRYTEMYCEVQRQNMQYQAATEGLGAALQALAQNPKKIILAHAA